MLLKRLREANRNMQEKTAHTLLGAFILSALAIAVVATLLVLSLIHI